MTPLPPTFTTFTRIREINIHIQIPCIPITYIPYPESQKVRCQRCHTYPLRSLLLHQTLMVGLQTPVQFRKNSGTLFWPVLQDLQIDAEDIVILMQVYTFALFTFM